MRSPKTKKKKIDEPSWFTLAHSELGVKEDPIHETSRIIEYHAATTYGALKDEVPWCSSFVSWCLENVGIESKKSAWARDYLNFGIKIKDPRKGCICVFRRGARNGHVAFYDSQTKNFIRVLGGNQGNKVCYANYKKSDLLQYRWPKI